MEQAKSENRIPFKTRLEAIASAPIFEVDTRHVGVLDGLRALGILIVLWFHFWQQTWLMPAYQTPFLQWLGVTQIYPNSFRRCGYLCVDLMLLLSAFVLYLPYARSAFFGTSIDTKPRFYLKRFARIVPSYLLVVLVTFFVALCTGAYGSNTKFLWKDLITHLTFTEMFFNDTYLFANITGVVWTVCIEVGFYIIFPWLAPLFRKHPLPVYLGMMAVGLGFTWIVALRVAEPRIMVNRFLTFLPVFANGMMAAHLYALYAAKVKYKLLPSIFGTALAVFGCWAVLKLFEMCTRTGAADAQQVWQMQFRAPLSFAFSAMMFGFCISMKPIRKILDNRVLAAIAAISYNIYLWHQWLMVRLRISLGANSGADIAAMGANAQWALTVTALIAVLVLAAFITYGFERPISGLILHKKKGELHAHHQ